MGHGVPEGGLAVRNGTRRSGRGPSGPEEDPAVRKGTGRSGRDLGGPEVDPAVRKGPSGPEGAQRSGMGPSGPKGGPAPGEVAFVLYFSVVIVIICQQHELTVSDQAQITLQLTVSLYELSHRFLADPPLLGVAGGGGGPKTFFIGARSSSGRPSPR
jgi:hypothetical protein